MSSSKKNFLLTRLLPFLPYLLVVLFCLAFTVLVFVRHDHYQSFGYDLGINAQTVWKYSQFELPFSTIDPTPDKPKLAEHVELVYALIAPFYWIWDSRRMLLLVRNIWFCFSAIAVYKLARKKKLNFWIATALTVGYLGFYGVQNAIWADLHSASFAAAFLTWFIYFLETKRKKISFVFFLLAITAKENIGLLTFLISLVYFWKEKSKLLLFYMAASVAYVAFIFAVFFPYIMHVTYLYQNSGGLFSNLNPLSFFDTQEKREVIWYSLLSFGFLPLLSPWYLLPAIGDLATYFVIANELPGAQGLYQQYRITLTPILLWATIITLSKWKFFNNKKIALYLVVCTLVVQYILHLPLSYLSKSWFWTEPSGVANINYMKDFVLPTNISVVAQNNIVPHISNRDRLYSLYPEKKIFTTNSPCGKKECNWFHWYGHPQFLFVDTSPEWDIRHLLANRDDFIDGLKNLEKAKIIAVYRRIGTTTLYAININPDQYH